MSKRHLQWRWILWLGGIGLVGVVVVAVLVLPWRLSTETPSIAANPAQKSSSVPVGTGIGEQALDFTLTDIDGNRFSLSDLWERPVVLYFSAAWCLPCVPETQELARHKARYPDLEIVWISVDPNSDSPESLRAHRRKYARDDFIYTLDTEEVAKLYQVVSLGDLYLLDVHGQIVFKGTRPVGKKPFEEALKKILTSY